MSDDDHTDRTLMEAGRLAMRGKLGDRQSDRRKTDKLGTRDLTAYALAILVPSGGSAYLGISSADKALAVMEMKQQYTDKRLDELTEWNKALSQRIREIERGKQ